MKRKPFLSELKKALSANKQKVDRSFYGVVQDVVEDSDGKVKAYKINLGGEESTVEARKFAGANIGDTVMCMLMANGQMVVTGTRDGDQDANEARKYATNYIKETDNGVEVSYNPPQTIPIVNKVVIEDEQLMIGNEDNKNVFINSEGVEIRNGETVNSSFSENLIEIGKNSSNAKIDLIKGIGRIEVVPLEEKHRLVIRGQTNCKAISILNEYGYSETGRAISYLQLEETEERSTSEFFNKYIKQNIDNESIITAETNRVYSNFIVKAFTGSKAYSFMSGSVIHDTGETYFNIYSKNILIDGDKFKVDNNGNVSCFNVSADHVNVIKTLKIKNESVEDYVIEQGVNSNWKYRLWHSGLIELTSPTFTYYDISTTSVYANSWYEPLTRYESIPFNITDVEFIGNEDRGNRGSGVYCYHKDIVNNNQIAFSFRSFASQVNQPCSERFYIRAKLLK